jgi:hypothetical protein
MVEDGEAEERRWEGGFHRGGFVLVWGMGWRMGAGRAGFRSRGIFENGGLGVTPIGRMKLSPKLAVIP